MDTVTALVRSIFQKESLDDCSLEELQAMARQYSYFTPVQFLLAEKLKKTDENLYKEQLQKLSLYFNNPLWLDYLLTANGAEEPPSATSEISERREEMMAAPTENGPPEISVLTQEQVTQQPIHNEMETIQSSENSEQFEAEISGSLEKTVESKESQKDENMGDAETESTEAVEENNSPSIPIPPLPKLDDEPSETELSFQPYHTVDYFASQGIKFVPEEKPTDRFGKQLKSFTEWLKTMKRLPQSEISSTVDIGSEKKVEQMAEHSIDQGEVITETMAEVWIKQGNKEKAIETYNKLSLLNPDKSAYFASLAEQLKNS